MVSGNSTKNNIFIGTSGWSYPHWREHFYPKSLQQQQWLSYYQARFRCTEINNTFYQLPSQDTLEDWRDTVSTDFIFAVKASRYITHLKKLKEPDTTTKTFFDRVAVLRKHLGPILFQLPPGWRFNGERLRTFLHSLDQRHRYVFEFRDRSWLNDEAYECLSQANAACCIYHLDGFLSPRVVTADFIYLRLHGPKGAYEGSYTRGQLTAWIKRILAWTQEGKRVYCFFDNDRMAYAAHNARQLQAMINKAYC